MLMMIMGTMLRMTLKIKLDSCHGDGDGITIFCIVITLTNIDTVCTFAPSSSSSPALLPFILILVGWACGILRMGAWPLLVCCSWTLKARNMLIAARKSNVGFEDEDEVFQGRVLGDWRPSRVCMHSGSQFELSFPALRIDWAAIRGARVDGLRAAWCGHIRLFHLISLFLSFYLEVHG